jgi:hypothetical protein
MCHEAFEAHPRALLCHATEHLELQASMREFVFDASHRPVSVGAESKLSQQYLTDAIPTLFSEIDLASG